MTSRHAPDDPPDVQLIASTLGDFLHDIYPERHQVNPSGMDLSQWLRQHPAIETAGASTEMIELFSDKIPAELGEVFLQHGVAVMKEDEFTAPWWMGELYPRTRGEYVKNLNWRPRYEPAASAFALHQRYLVEAREKQKVGDRASAESLYAKAEGFYKASLRTFKVETPFLLVRRDVAMRYLAAVAAKTSEDLKTDLFAEDSEFAEVALGSVRTSRASVALTTLEAYLPRDLAMLEPKRLAEFRADAAHARIRFQGAIQSLVKEFAELSSEGQLRAMAKSINDAARERVEQTRQSYKRARLQATIGSLGISLSPPALLASLSSLLGIGIFTPAAIASAVALFAAKTLLDLDKARVERDSSVWSYIFRVEDAFSRVS